MTRIGVVGCLAALLLPVPTRGQGCFADVNGDGRVSITDVIAIVRQALDGCGASGCIADVNRDGQFNIADAVAAVRELLSACGEPTATPTLTPQIPSPSRTPTPSPTATPPTCPHSFAVPTGEGEPVCAFVGRARGVNRGVCDVEPVTAAWISDGRFVVVLVVPPEPATPVFIVGDRTLAPNCNSGPDECAVVIGQYVQPDASDFRNLTGSIRTDRSGLRLDLGTEGGTNPPDFGECRDISLFTGDYAGLVIAPR